MASEPSAAAASSLQSYAQGPALGVVCQPSESVCVIEAVTPGSPAELAGMLPGDTITYVDEHPVSAPITLIDTLAFNDPGDAVVITVQRNGQPLEFEVVPAPRSSLSWGESP